MKTNKEAVKECIKTAKEFIKVCEAYLKDCEEYVNFREKYNPGFNKNREPDVSRKLAKAKRKSMDLHDVLVQLRKPPFKRE